VAFIPSYKYDIFISYAHVDNLTVSSSAIGWVEQFEKYLEVQISKRIGRMGMIRMWRDKKLDGSQLFDDVIKNRVDNSAIFLALTSTGYLSSDYCKQELKWFHKKAQVEKFGLRLKERLRIFNVLLYNIPFENWPEEFSRISGFNFHDSEDREDFGAPLDPETKEFQFQMRKLVDAIYKVLKSYSELASESQISDTDTTAAPEAREEIYDVYLTAVADSLRSTQKRVISDLSRQGIKVHKIIPPPYEAKSHEQAVITAMKNSTLCTHLLDELGGAEIEGDEVTTYPRKQMELGFEYAHSQLIWVPRNLKIATIEDQQQKAFLNSLENEPRKEEKFDFLRGISSEISDEIIEKLNQEKKAALQVDVPSAALLDTHLKDQSFVMEMSRALIDKNILPYINPQEDDPRHNLSQLKDRLNKVGALIIIYGQVSGEWVKARLEEAVKIIVSESCPVKAFCICLAPPDEAKIDLYSKYQFLNLHLLDNRQGFNLNTLEPLFNSLRVGDG
jgi:hypothetical protein